jgi:hypothetical protein
MSGYHIAHDDKRDIMARAHIDMLEQEILHKAKVLIAQSVDNPGLKPVLEIYLKHIRDRREDATRMLQYLHTLMLSINTIIVPPQQATRLTHSKSKSKSYNGGGGTSIESKMQSDQQAIMAEIVKWKNVLAETSEHLN